MEAAQDLLQAELLTAAAAEEVSTIFVGGIPADASPRELDNLCRFLPGFVNSKISSSSKGTMLFALFDCAQNAQTAILLLNDQVFDRTNPTELMRAAMARSNMRATAPFPAAPAPVTFQPQSAGWGASAALSAPLVNVKLGVGLGGPAAMPQSAPAWGNPGGPGGKRPRMHEDPNNVDTVAVVGAAEAGIDEAALQAYFSQLQGFIAFKSNPRMGGGFVKFGSAQLAAQAAKAAQAEGVPAEIARSSMSVIN